jgi:hypothetical protein
VNAIQKKTAASVLLGTALMSAIFGFQSHAFAQGGLPLWTNRYNGPGSGYDQGTAIALDTNGDVFVTGYSVGTNVNAWFDYATIAYSASGIPLWTNRYNGPGNGWDKATAISVANGRVFVTGYATNSATGNNYATIAYSTGGGALWTNFFNGSANGQDYATALGTDSSGDVFVTGYSASGASGDDYATVKYSSAGATLWTRRYNDALSQADNALALAVDRNGNVFVTGKSGGLDFDYATVAYSSGGVALWTNYYNGPAGSRDEAYAIAIDSQGHVFVTGASTGNGSSLDFATVAYSSAGAPLWTNRYDGTGGNADVAIAVAANDSGQVFVSGYSIGASGNWEYATLAYSSSGQPLWTNRYHGPGAFSDEPTAIATDGYGNVFVTGYSSNTNGYYDYATVAYSSAGLGLWTNRYHGQGNGYDQANAIAVDRAGNVFVTGNSMGAGSDCDYATIKYSPTAPPATELTFEKLNNQLVLTWTNAGFALQSAADLTATFTNIPGAASPYTNSIANPQQYFRLLKTP